MRILAAHLSDLRSDTVTLASGELVVSRRGQPIARILPVSRRRPRPDHADLRSRMPRLSSPSVTLIREER